MEPPSTLLLPDGRTLAWREFGDPAGFPVIFTHGVFNSRLFSALWERTAAASHEAGARVLAVDRPGYGRSTFCPGRSYVQWAADVRHLARELGLQRFAVLGFSSGGPSALACAHELPDMVAACGICSSDCPYALMDALGVDGAGHRLRMFGTTELTPERSLKNARQAYQALEQSYAGMKNRERAALALADLQESALQGLDKGIAQDGRLESRDWGFDLAKVTLPVLLWHGEADKEVPAAAGRWLASQLPGCRATFLPGEGHSLLRRQWEPILRALVQAGQADVPRPRL